MRSAFATLAHPGNADRRHPASPGVYPLHRQLHRLARRRGDQHRRSAATRDQPTAGPGQRPGRLRPVPPKHLPRAQLPRSHTPRPVAGDWYLPYSRSRCVPRFDVSVAAYARASTRPAMGQATWQSSAHAADRAPRSVANARLSSSRADARALGRPWTGGQGIMAAVNPGEELMPAWRGARRRLAGLRPATAIGAAESSIAMSGQASR